MTTTGRPASGTATSGTVTTGIVATGTGATGTAATKAKRPTEPDDGHAWDVAAAVCDPEIPVLTIEDLGVLRNARVEPRERPDGSPGRVAHIEITPTYSGCPAMDTFRVDIVQALTQAGYDDATVTFVLAPAWTTDWMTDIGRDKLAAYGISPPTGLAPIGRREPGRPVAIQLAVRCPRCGSLATREQARFASTSCKALYACNDCLEPFDYFKVL